ncbi:MAG TPA: DUF4058 family protein [Urbifossiella sp.]|nr:DUF4058 family protein [Urbifossiella sp.]
MPSPFPGMDPWLEGSLWPDVHGSLIFTIREAIAARLPAGYFANVDQYVWLSDGEGEPVRRGQPDTFVSGDGGPIPGVNLTAAAPTLHVRLPTPKRVRKKRYIRLLDTEDRSVVTVIELLSPSDKLPKKDRARYLAKREEYLAAGVNLVEIDLLRRGLRVPMGKPEAPAADYFVLVSRAAEYPDADVWAFDIRDAIPRFPVPLKSEHGGLTLDLRSCLDRAYDAAHYERLIDYSKPAAPVLRKPDAVWAVELLKTYDQAKATQESTP